MEKINVPGVGLVEVRLYADCAGVYYGGRKRVVFGQYATAGDAITEALR